MKRIFILLLALVLSVQVITATKNQEEFNLNYDQQKEIVHFVENQIIESYSNYYTIPTINVEIESVNVRDNQLIIDLKANITKVLKVNSALELPYVKGMLEEISNIRDKYDFDRAKRYAENLIKDLNYNYIGVEQNENADFQMQIPIIAERSNLYNTRCNLLFKDENNDTLTMEEFAPLSEEMLEKDGKRYINNIIEHQKYSIRSSSPGNYDRIIARDYVRKWSDACGECHCSDCDPSKLVYNPSYANYHNNDCANFVSQAIHEAGVPTDDKWRPGNRCWYNTGHEGDGLIDYMVEEGLFFETNDRYKAFAGSIIKWTEASHVGMVDQNDTVTMTFCAHTDDRNSCAFRTIRGLTFFVPVWDSYSKQWTPQ